jgi:hypothetical protein
MDAQVNISCKPMLKGRVWQNHGLRDETHTENSFHDPFGSRREHLPKRVVQEIMLPQFIHDYNHKLERQTILS